jgi:glycosyltransferase involved in cell wall biosynthesis
MSTKKIRILMLAAVYSPPFSGAGYVAQLLKDSVFAEAFDLLHINTRFVDSVSDLETINLTKFVLFIKYLWLLFAALLTRRPDFVIIGPTFSKGTFLKSSIYTLVCSALFGRRVIWWAHGLGLRRLYDSSGPLIRRYIRWVVTSVYRVVTVGYRQRSDFDFICSREQVFTIYHGIPAREFSRNRLEGRRDIRVLYFSNLDATKGWKILLEAAKQICACRDGVIFDFYGNPTKDTSKETIEAAFQGSGFTDRIYWHGPAYGLAKHQAYDTADIFCFPTYLETFGLVNLEAMNAGLPVISTDHSNIPEIVHDGRGGFLVPTEDPAALSTAILRLVDDGELRGGMGEYNRQRFYEHFTVDKFVDRWVEFIHSLAAANVEGGKSCTREKTPISDRTKAAVQI